MTKFYIPRNANSGQELRVEFRGNYADFRGKRDRALVRKAATTTDLATLPLLDGLQPGLGYFSAANGPAREQLVGHLLMAHKRQREIEPRFEHLHVTIIDDRWSTSDEKTLIDLPFIVGTSTAILNQIAPDWTAAIELGVFTNRKHASGGKLLSPHIHGIVRGHSNFPQAQTVAVDWNEKLRACVEGADAVCVQRIGDTWLDLAHVIRYPFKASNRVKTEYRNPDGRINLHESEKGDRYIRYLRLFQLLSLLEQRQLMFAGGAGGRLHEWALAEVDRHLTERNARCSQLVGLFDVDAFWADLMPRLGWHRFIMPRIITP